MSNNYETITVLTMLPPNSLSKAHRIALRGCGFCIEDSAKDIYLYSNEARSIDHDDGNDAIRELSESEAANPGAEAAFQSWLLEELSGPNEVYWEDVLQRVLQGLPEGVPHLDLQAAYWCDKERPDEFGGWAMRITREDVRSFGVAEWLREQDAIDAAASAPPDNETFPFDTIFIEGGRDNEFADAPAFVEVPVAGFLAAVKRLCNLADTNNLSEASILHHGATWVGGTPWEDGATEENEWRVDCEEMVVVPSPGSPNGEMYLRALRRHSDQVARTASIDIAILRAGLATGKRYYTESDEAWEVTALHDLVAEFRQEDNDEAVPAPSARSGPR